jgi:hypothetical protein
LRGNAENAGYKNSTLPAISSGIQQVANQNQAAARRRAA